LEARLLVPNRNCSCSKVICFGKINNRLQNITMEQIFNISKEKKCS
jgi:hypothetical protein